MLDRFEKFVAALLLVLLAVSVRADQVVQTSNSAQPIVATTISGTAGTFTTGVTVGSSTPTQITNIRVYAASLTPAATSAAIQTAEQTFTVTGLATTDKVFVNGPAPTSLCPPTTFRVSAANTIAIGFSVLTAAACTPAAGTYNIVAVRS